jgi:hypothetical protein
MINEIEIRNRASFDNTGIKIKDLKKINFVPKNGRVWQSKCNNSMFQLTYYAS